MRSSARIILAATALAVLGWLGWAFVRSVYFEPRAGFQKRIANVTTKIAEYDQDLADHRRVAGALRHYVDHTLGGDLETTDHQLRSRLNRIGEQIGLKGLVVGTGRARTLQSPAKSQFSLRNYRTLREEIDFVEIEGWISGEGTLPQVLQLVHRIEAEPWLKRVHQVRLDPKNNGQRFAVSVRLVTLFMPGRTPMQPDPQHTLASYDPAGFDPYVPLVDRNPFRVPPPPPPPTPAPTRAAAVPPPATFGGWTLTGVASGPAGVEVWLLNPDSGESRRLAIGETLRDLVLVEASGEIARFQRAEKQFTVAVGQRFRDRIPRGK